jgi:hypothetical protein
MNAVAPMKLWAPRSGLKVLCAGGKGCMVAEPCAVESPLVLLHRGNVSEPENGSYAASLILVKDELKLRRSIGF